MDKIVVKVNGVIYKRHLVCSHVELAILAGALKVEMEEAHLSFSESKDFIIHPRPSSGAGGRLGETSYQGNIPNFKNAEHMVFYKSLKDPTCSVAPVPSEAGILGKICIRRSDADPAGCIQ